MDFKRISVAEAAAIIDQQNIAIADIRDEQTFASGHIKNAWHLTNTTLHQFMQETDFHTPVLVVCYHGNSSQGAAQYLSEQGFEEVYSLDGGFESWRIHQPYETSDNA